jgi:hypothetical protein
VIAATVKYATIEELLEAVFSVQSLPRLYNEIQLLYESKVWSRQLVSSNGVRQLPACKDRSPEAEEHPPLEALTKQCD